MCKEKLKFNQGDYVVLHYKGVLGQEYYKDIIKSVSPKRKEIRLIQHKQVFDQNGKETTSSRGFGVSVYQIYPVTNKERVREYHRYTILKQLTSINWEEFDLEYLDKLYHQIMYAKNFENGGEDHKF